MPHRVETSPVLGGDPLYSSQGPMAQTQTEPPLRDQGLASDTNSQSQQQQQQQQSLWRRLIFGRDKDNGSSVSSDLVSKGQGSDQHDDPKAGIIRRVSRKVVPGLPRAQTFKRQQSELRDKLEPVQQTPAERRAVSMDRRMHTSTAPSLSQSNPRTSAPDFLHHTLTATASVPSLPTSQIDEKLMGSIGDMDEIRPEWEVPHDMPHISDAISLTDAHSMTTSQYDSMIHDELERIWILNLSMHFRDKSKREKFFVTYREHDTLWRRVTVSVDYRNAPENSLEMELVHTKFQRDKSAKIYEAIRESLADIQFYNTVTNLKLQTTDGRLHVHVVEDVNEIINYPTMRMIQHMRCRRVKEREIEFDSHLSGFVYKVRVDNEMLIKKEIPGPDTVDEFLYEINALNRLRSARNVIQFYGVVVDDKEEHVKGLLISFAEQGALIDVLYDGEHSLSWNTRERWARQIVNGLAEIHEAGFVQGDFTLSNIVVNDEGDAKIIDINRRGCPVGWEPPEATPLIESNQRISMYIGVKSDLFQLGMVLWALATQEDEPEAHGRPLKIDSDLKVPAWYCRIVEICLSEDPRHRIQALHLLSMFPSIEEESEYGHPHISSISIDQKSSRPDNLNNEFGPTVIPEIKTVQPPSDWAYVGWGNRYSSTEDPYSYPTRGRSPPSPIPSNHRGYVSQRYGQAVPSWSGDHDVLTAPSVDGIPGGEAVTEPNAHCGTDDVGKAQENNASAQVNHASELVSTPGVADGDMVLKTETTTEQPGLVKDSAESSRQIATGEDTWLTPDLNTPIEAAELAEKSSLDVSQNPIFDGEEAGKTEPDIKQAASENEEGEQKASSTAPRLADNEGPPHASELAGSIADKPAETAVAGEGGILDVTDAPAEAAPRDSSPANFNQNMADSLGPTKPGDVLATIEKVCEADAPGKGASPRLSPSASAAQARVPDALTGIGSAHHFDMGLDSENRPALISDDDDFGLGAFVKSLETTTTTDTDTGVSPTAVDHDHE